MKIINTLDYITQAQLDTLTPNEAYWFYSGMDSCITEEIRHKLLAQLDDTTRATYNFTMKMQAPILEMMLRGIRVDEDHRRRAILSTEQELEELTSTFNRICQEGLGLSKPINPGSHIQVKELFYDILDLKEIKKRNSKGSYARASDRDTLEKLNQYFIAQPFVAYILAIRDKRKVLGFLRTPADADGRMRCSFGLAGTNTGRLNSSFSDFGTGTNLQNVDRNLRYIFVADPGKILVNIDLEQADSRNVGALCWNLFHESHGASFAGSYLDACESGDLHTTVCRMAWTNLPWGSDPAGYRKVADSIAYRTYSYRDMSKKLGHGSNYYGQPPTMAVHAKLPVNQVQAFQDNYFGAFPCIPEYHKWVINTLQSTRQITHLFGRRRTFFDDVKAQSTINAAIAYSPQGMTGEEINRGLLALWYDPRFELMVQVHDSILFQVDYDKVNELVPLALNLMEAHLTLKGDRDFFVPLEAKTGFNWGDHNDKNPLGLKKWKGEETRKPPVALMKKRKSILDM